MSQSMVAVQAHSCLWAAFLPCDMRSCLPYRWAMFSRSLLAISVAALCPAWPAEAAWKVCFVPGSFCARPAVKGVTLAALLVGLVLLYLGYTYA